MAIDPQYPGVQALAGRVERAIDFAARTDLYYGYGRTSAWGTLPDDPAGTDETNPPMPDPVSVALQEPVAYVKATVQLVVPDPDGAIDFDDVSYRAITAAEARELLSPYVYVAATLDRAQVPTGKYRQLGIFSRLVRDVADEAANPGRTELWVTPETPGETHVTSPGVLEYLCNDLADDHRSNEVDTLEVVLTF